MTGTAFADTFNAGATANNPGGFSQTSTNAGSGSSAGANANEFEGRGGDDLITGNGSTRVSYFHATGGSRSICKIRPQALLIRPVLRMAIPRLATIRFLVGSIRFAAPRLTTGCLGATTRSRPPRISTAVAAVILLTVVGVLTALFISLMGGQQRQRRRRPSRCGHGCWRARYRRRYTCVLIEGITGTNFDDVL